MRTPLPQFGEILVFNYNTVHRGGDNTSPDIRTILYQTYVQKWFRDKNFENDAKYGYGSTNALNRLFGNLRAAIPEYTKPEDPSVTYQLDDLETMGKFEPTGGLKVRKSVFSSKIRDVTVGNVDVDVGGMVLCILSQEQEQDAQCYHAPPVGQGAVIPAYEGDEIRILYHDDTTNTNIVLKSWLIKGREQSFISYQHLDRCLWKDKCVTSSSSSTMSLSSVP